MLQTVAIDRKDTIRVFDTNIKYVGTLAKWGVEYRNICYWPPWSADDSICEYLALDDVVSSVNPDDAAEWIRITLKYGASAMVRLEVERSQFQYQVIFDLEHPKLGLNASLLEAEYAKYESAGWREVVHEEPDCFPTVALHLGDVDESPQFVWLCQAVEYGKSPCDPLPYWLCPWPSSETIYFRGECTCSNFKDTLQPLGIPCCHLIAALKWYAGKPAYCPYVQCD